MKTMPRGALKVTCSLDATLQASGSGTAIADCAGYLREGSGYLLLPFRRMYGPKQTSYDQSNSWAGVKL